MNLKSTFCKKRLSLLLIFALFLLFCASAGKRTTESARAQAEYEVVILTAPQGLTDTVGQGVGAGAVVGTGRIADAPDPEQTHALLWPRGSSVGVDLHPPDFRYSAALETDGQRQVGSGNGPSTQFQRHALLWTGSAASVVDLHPQGIWTDSIARAIAGNEQVGNINFYYQGNESSPQSEEHAALWHGTAASVVDLHPTGIHCDRSYGNDTDGAHQVGYGYFDIPGTTSPYRALLWSGTAASVVVLHPAGFSHSFAEGVSGNEQVGYAFNTFQGDGYSRALLWHGTAASVVILNPQAYVSSAALATNGTNQVGYGGGPDTNWQSHALRWSGTAASVLDLHTLLPAEFSLGSIAYDIDSEGNITGLAQRADGSTSAVLWRRIGGSPSPTPTPTPTPTQNIPPQVQMMSPTSGQTLSSRKAIQLVAQATDADGSVSRVDFYANDMLIGKTAARSANGTYKYSWKVSTRSMATYRIKAQAMDNRGASATSSTVTVRISP